MKKLINILILIVFAVSANAQLVSKVHTDTILDFSTMTGADTLIWVKYYSGKPVSVEMEYTTVDADDATVEIGYSNTGTSHCNSSSTDFPFTLDATTNAVSGAATTSLMVIKREWNPVYISIFVTKNSVTSGVLINKYFKL